MTAQSIANSLCVEEWDTTYGLIAMNNGVLDLKTKKLRNPNPSDRLTKKLTFDFIPGSTCEELLDDLWEISCHKKSRYYLILTMLWMCIHGQCGLKAYFELNGSEGNNGKSTVLNLMEVLVGRENTLTSQTDDFSSQYGLCDLRGKSLILVPEAGGYIGKSGRLKSLTGGDTVRLEQKYQPTFEVVFDGVIAFASNKLIQFSDSSGAIERRRIAIPFERKFEAKEQRPLLVKSHSGFTGEWVSQIPGLFNYLLENISPTKAKKALTKYRTGKNPDVIKARLESAKTDAVKEWALECLHYQVGARLGRDHTGFMSDNGFIELPEKPYEQYRNWSLENGRKCKSHRDWSSDILTLLKSFGLDANKARTNKYRYIQNVFLRRNGDINLEDQIIKNTSPEQQELQLDN